MPEVYVGYVDVDVDLEDYDTEELREELERRGESFVDKICVVEMIRDLYQKRRNGQDYQRELDNVIYETIGRM